jgi:hypothetical protein
MGLRGVKDIYIHINDFVANFHHSTTKILS